MTVVGRLRLEAPKFGAILGHLVRIEKWSFLPQIIPLDS